MDTKNEIIKEQKKELRTKVKEKISKLSRRETEESDKKILHQIKSTQFSVMSVQKKKLIPFRFCRKYWTVEKDWVFLNVPEKE